MSFAAANDDSDDVMSEINMTPLVDVMLVLLIIFIITIPVIKHSVKLDLPRASTQANDSPAPRIDVSLDAAGQVFWNGQAVDQAALQSRIATAAGATPAPELRIHADRQTPYEQIAQLLAAAQRAGLSKIGLITEPKS